MSIGKRLARIGLPRLIINLTVLVVVALWVMPTLGIFVSSFRDKDQLTVSGWWTAFSSSERNEAGRLGGLDLMKQEGMTGNCGGIGRSLDSIGMGLILAGLVGFIVTISSGEDDAANQGSGSGSARAN